jgi:predicted nucleotidyltransferase component of viral defense system
MLHKTTVEPATLELLNQLTQMPQLAPFALVGGTNLSLRFGHRLSVDLDLFTDQPFDEQQLSHELTSVFPNLIKVDEARNTLSLLIEGVKIDLLAHRYALLAPVESIDSLRLWSLPDIVAMKLGAVSSRGAKKDFWDIAQLLNQFTLPQMLRFFSDKYPNSDPGFVVRSLTYFDDANQEPDPISLQQQTWDQVKNTVQQAVRSLMTDPA